MAWLPAKRDGEHMQHYDSHLGARLAVVVVAALGAGLALAVAVGAAAAGVLLPEPTGDLSELGSAFAAALIAFLAGAAAYTAVTVLGVRRVVAEGRRVATSAALLVTPPLLAVTTGLALVRDATPLGVVGAFGFLAATVIAVLAISGALVVAWAFRAGAGAAAVAAVCIGLSLSSNSGASEGADLDGIYRRSAIPLALVDGTALDAPIPGWQLRPVEHPLDRRLVPAPLAKSSERATIYWNVRGTFVRLDMVAQPAAVLADCPYAACDRLGTTPQGGLVMGGRAPGGPSSRQYESVWVDVEGGRWQLVAEGPSRTLDVREAVQVLSRLQRVDVDRYLAVTGR
jgi:hypothetical protein